MLNTWISKRQAFSGEMGDFQDSQVVYSLDTQIATYDNDLDLLW
jgi:hypothetical protein